MRQWGIGILGDRPDFQTIVHATRALRIYDAFRTEIKRRTDDDWKIISGVMKVINDA